MALATRERPGHREEFTVEDFFARVEDGQKADLIDGVIYMASPDTPRNNRIASFIFALLNGWVDEHELGEVYTQRVAFIVNESNAPEPDVAFLANENLGRVGPTRVKGGPDIAVEVISTDSRNRDLVLKRGLYETAGVREYWLVDPIRNECVFLENRDGVFIEMPVNALGIFRSNVLPGFWLDVNWFRQDVLPRSRVCLARILAGEPS